MNIYYLLQSLSAAILDDSDAPTLIERFEAVNREVNALVSKVDSYELALRLISAPMRPDGTFNRSREACQKLAEEMLTEHGTQP